MGEAASEHLLAYATAILEALDRGRVGVLTTTIVDGVITSLAVNDAGLAIFGLTREELLSRSVFDFIAPRDRERIAELRARRAGGEESANELELTFVQPSGREVPLRYSIQELKTPNGVVTVAIFADVSARRDAEDALRAEERRLRSLFESAPDGIVISRDGLVLEANPAAARMLGYESESELAGVSLHSLMSPSDTNAMIERIAAARGGMRFAPRAYEARRRDGSRCVAEITSVPCEHHGKPAVMGFARDVTDRVRLEAQLAQNDRLAALGTLAAGVAHEINNPLTVLSLGIQALDHDLRTKQEDELASRISELQTSIERIAAIVRELRVFSRADQGTLGATDVVETLRAAEHLVSHQLRHHAKLVTSYERVPYVTADAGRLEQVVVNLLLNAAQALPEGRQENEIGLRCYVDGEHVAIEVKDNGPGMPPEVLARVFEPFFTTKPVGTGTGLGLAISYGIVKRFGGDIVVDSEVGRGTKARVVLSAATAQSTGKRARLRLDEPASRRAKILVVDDEPRLLAAIEMLLANDHDVTTVGGGNAAAEILAERGAEIDVVLCDLMMAGGSGIELYEHTSRTAPALIRRFVMMTGGACTPRAAAFLARVPNRVLEKPFSFVSVQAAITSVLEEADHSTIKVPNLSGT